MESDRAGPSCSANRRAMAAACAVVASATRRGERSWGKGCCSNVVQFPKKNSARSFKPRQRRFGLRSACPRRNCLYVVLSAIAVPIRVLRGCLELLWLGRL